MLHIGKKARKLFHIMPDGLFFLFAYMNNVQKKYIFSPTALIHIW